MSIHIYIYIFCVYIYIIYIYYVYIIYILCIYIYIIYIYYVYIYIMCIYIYTHYMTSTCAHTLSEFHWANQNLCCKLYMIVFRGKVRRTNKNATIFVLCIYYIFIITTYTFHRQETPNSVEVGSQCTRYKQQ